MRSNRPRFAFAVIAGLALTLGIAPGALSQPAPKAGAKAPAAKGAAPKAGAPKGGAKKKDAKKDPAPAPSASAAPDLPPPVPSASASAEPVLPPAPTVVRKQVPPPPPPAPEKLAALAELEKEADAYEKNARDYRSTITGIVKHHYEDRKRRILSALDTEIATEKKGLRDAREEAIRRLEAFVAKYSGANAHPENSPDAMFRLAALYEERARTDTDSSEDLAVGLKPAIALYKRIIKEFPQYRELAGIYYYLGHAYNDSSRLPEAQQVWRSLVCHNKYAYPTPPDPKDPDKDTVVRLPQDHDRDYWTGWENRHPTPIGGSAMGGGKGGKPRPAAAPAKKKGKGAAKEEPSNTSLDDEVSFRNPFTNDCKPIPQKTLPGQEPRYIAEVWWLIGDYYFNEVDPAGGAFNYNRAEAAYQQSVKYKKPPVHGVSMYKLAWTYFKQQRYETSVRAFIDLLRYTDAEEKRTGDPGTDFRAEAYTYIAGSLTYLDFVGPGADDPYVPRNDILDVETDPRIAEQKMRIAIERVQDPKLIPQNEKWTVDIYKALAQEFRELNQLRNTVEVDELILRRWPMHRDAPVVQNEIADIYDKLTAQSREGTAERKENAAKALDARTKLSAYVGATRWVDANKNDPEAIQTAERLVHGGLRRAAADHTNAGSALVQQALSIQDKETRDPIFERALTEYKLAAQGWEGYLAQDENASDAYESRYWLADANHNVIVILVAMERTPTPNEIEAARRTAVAVRDSNEDDKFLQPAAFMVVDTAQQVLNDQYHLYERSKGAQGLERHEQVKTTGEGENIKVVKEPMPPAVLAAVAARDEYIQRVPPHVDVATSAKEGGKNANLYAFQSADFFFLYGNFEEAAKRLEPMYREQCDKNGWGYKAWSRLMDIAALSRDVPGSRKLADEYEKKRCVMTDEQKAVADRKAKDIKSGGYYIDAYEAFQAAEKMPDGPERVKQWRKAGALYQAALKNAPARDEAPEAAINGAYAYKQVGDYDQAIEMYSLFIKEYGSEDNLKKLEKGDASVSPPKPADPKKYGERVKFLKQAYGALSDAYVLFFSYRSAAETFDTIAKNPRFEKPARREAALQAVVLYSSIGDKEKMLATRQTFYSLDPPAEKKAEIDWRVAEADLKAWDEHGLDEGTNRGERLKAIAAMDSYHAMNKNKNEAAAYVVMAAYQSAKLRKAGKDPKAADWCKSTIAAFEKFRGTAKITDGKNTALGSPQADMAAECAYGAIDERIHADFDYDTGHHRYAGVIDKVVKAYTDDLKKAEKYFNELQDVIVKFESRPWSVAAKARQGSLYDSCRTGLYNARPPALKLYSDKEEKLLKLAETSGRDDLQETADALRQKRREDWRAARERQLDDGDKPMIKFYTEAVVYGRAFKVRNAAVDTAIQRLAFYTNILGDAKLRDLTQGVLDPETKQPFVYSDGLFLRTRPGMAPQLKSDELPSPLPVAP
ncbi:MAG: tetratricopeptide repeat protein [Minicystis sp.]